MISFQSTEKRVYWNYYSVSTFGEKCWYFALSKQCRVSSGNWVQYFGKDSILDAVGTIRTLIEKRKILEHWLFIVVLGVCSQNQIKIDLFPYDTYCCLEEKNVTSRIFGLFLQHCRKRLLIHWMLDRSLGTIKENDCQINQVLSVIIIAQYQEQLLYWVF